MYSLDLSVVMYSKHMPCILEIFEHVRSQGGRQPAAAKPPWYDEILCSLWVRDFAGMQLYFPVQVAFVDVSLFLCNRYPPKLKYTSTYSYLTGILRAVCFTGVAAAAAATRAAVVVGFKRTSGMCVKCCL